MPNWCSTAYVIEGNAKEVEKLYKLMKDLQERKEPSMKNGFGTTWLGCLVDALGGDWNKIRCRGAWNSLERVGDTLQFATETAWAPCTETFDWVSQKFPSIRCFYITEEPGMTLYATNDRDGKYFPDKYLVDMCTPEEEYHHEYFSDLPALYEWLEDILEKPVKSEEDVNAVIESWQEDNDNAYCYIYPFQIVA